MASGVVTQAEDYTIRNCRRLIKFANGQQACYQHCLSWCFCARGKSDEEIIEAHRKSQLLHQAALACLLGEISHILFDLLCQTSTRNEYSQISLTSSFDRTSISFRVKMGNSRCLLQERTYRKWDIICAELAVIWLWDAGMTDLIIEGLHENSDLW